MIIFKCPAKLNLFLDILSKRTDGYHNILSLMVKVSLYDELKLFKIEKRKIILNVEGQAPSGDENICVRTVKLMQEKFGLDSGINITLKKNIPPESGLGGASSDAACVIKGVSEIFNLGLSHKEMVELGSGLGSDIPFFINDSTWALVSGRGEIIKSLSLDVNFWAVLVLPGFRIKTEDAYLKWRPSLTDKNLWDKIKDCDSKDINFNYLRQCSYNIFEKIVDSREIDSLKVHFKNLGAEFSTISGSGSTVYGVFRERKEAMQGEKYLSSLGYKVYLVEPLKEGGACFGDNRD